MPYKPIIPPIPVDQVSTQRAVRDLREMVMRLVLGDGPDPRERAVTIADLVEVGVLTQAQAEKLVRR